MTGPGWIRAMAPGGPGWWHWSSDGRHTRCRQDIFGAEAGDGEGRRCSSCDTLAEDRADDAAAERATGKWGAS